ncbi:chromate transporter [Porphyromonas gingivicanis]|uniref:Chromate transporter n=1 Tax=Porphyromonas gingivicanis TaxID=266762 RepID=A0A0A2GD26_9PORP|nr:chromate transporter [Porphyromonas gingivicanis]KGN98329.1 chromate transporter [Porphyromonas gingivicanis]
MLFHLFRTFFQIGLFTFGGGYAMLPLIEHEVVERHKWFSQNEFLDLFAVAQSLPGVFAVNISIFVGYRLDRFRGGFVAAIATILPSFLVLLGIALFFENIQENRYVIAIMQGIRPAVVALIALPVYTTWRKMALPLYMLVIPIVVALLVWFWGVSPIIIILASSLVGLLYGMGIKPLLNKKEKL